MTNIQQKPAKDRTIRGKTNMILRHRNKLVYCIFILTSLFSFSAKAIDLPSQTALYSVTYVGKNAGELEVVIEKQNNQLSVKTISHLSLLAKMFLTAQTSTALFRIDNQKATLLEGADYLQKDNSRIRSFNVNRQQNLLSLSNGENTPIEPNIIIEADSFPISLITSEIATLGGIKVRVVSGKRTRWYRYRNPEEVTLETANGKIDAWKIARERLDNPQTSVTFWLDKNNNQMPAKIVTTNKGKETVLTRIN